MRDTHMHFCFQNSWPSRGKVGITFTFVPLSDSSYAEMPETEVSFVWEKHESLWNNWELEIRTSLSSTEQSYLFTGRDARCRVIPLAPILKKHHQTTQTHVKFFVSHCPRYFGSFLFWQSLVIQNQWLKKTRVGRNNFTDSWIKTWWVFDTCCHYFFTWTRTWISLLPNLTTGTIRDLGQTWHFWCVGRQCIFMTTPELNPCFLILKNSLKKHWTLTFPCKEGDTSPYPSAALLQEHPLITKIRTQAERLLGIEDNQLFPSKPKFIPLKKVSVFNK